MSELIDREALLSHECEADRMGAMLVVGKGYILNATIIDPVVHGEWIEDGSYQICSECGEEHAWIDYRASFCDNCGAKMDKHRESEGT